MASFTYTLPTIGGSEDNWGANLNANWTALGSFIGALDSAELAVLDGLTATTAELNILDGVTATAAELNILDGVTATTAEINYVDGVTSAIQTQIDAIASSVSGAIVPSGTVIHVAQNTAPTGYLKANGSAVSRTTYAALFAAIGTTFGSGDGSTTFNVPDLRGEFVRGWDDSRGVDSGRSFGSTQTDTLRQHNHDSYVRTDEFGSGDGRAIIGTSAADEGLRTNGPDMGVSGISTSFGSYPISASNISGETRPRNLALLACIKT